jgi:hypothetical protein
VFDRPKIQTASVHAKIFIGLHPQYLKKILILQRIGVQCVHRFWGSAASFVT